MKEGRCQLLPLLARFDIRAVNNAPWLTSSSLEMMCRRTSGNSSLSIWRNIGRRWSIVLTLLANIIIGSCWNILLLAKDRCESADLGSKGSSNMLGGI